MKYSEIYASNFIDKLNELNKEAAGIDADEEISQGYIDIQKMIEELGFELRFDSNFVGSGQIRGTKITIDSSESEERQRFSMAHELGHAFQNVRIAQRNDDNSNYSQSEHRDEVFANTFAAQLLMPKVLVRKIVDDIIHSHNINNASITPTEYQQIVTSAAKKMWVSTQAMRYRIKNLNIFVPVGE